MGKRQIKPVHGWGITYCNDPNVMPWTIRETRRQAIQEHGDGWNWPRWRKYGCRCVRVTIIQEQQP